MASLSPIPAYFLGTACIGRGAMAILEPRKEYGHVGLPLEAQAGTGAATTGLVSPFIYFKGIREITFGATMVALQYTGEFGALTTFAAILSLTRLGDGLVVWLYGGEEKLKMRAWGHWITGIGMAGWTIWRLRH